MIHKKNDDIVGNLFQFSPYLIFITSYISLYCYTLQLKNIHIASTATIFTGLPIFVAFIATMYAFFSFKEDLTIERKIEIFISGVANQAAIHCYIAIILIAIFNHMVAKTNGVLTAVTLSLLYIPTSLIMPCIFFISSILSMILVSLPATIIICMPIAYGIAQSLQINPAFMVATVIGGALSGNHLSLYSNHFHTYTKKTLPYLIQIYNKTIWFVVPAVISTFIILSRYQCQPLHPTTYQYLKSSLTINDNITILPYCFLLIAASLNINLLLNVIIAACIALIIEILYHKVIFLDAITTMFTGFYEESIVANLLLLHLIIAGLTKIIQYNDGFTYIIEILKSRKNQNRLITQLLVIFITIIVNLLVIIDTIALHIIKYPIKTIAHKYHIPQDKVDLLIHITTTMMQVIVPYSSIMFLAIYINHSSYVEIMNYMIYPIFITIFTIISIFFNNPATK